MTKISILNIYSRTPVILKILILILLTWGIQTLFLYPAVHWGMNWDDWRWLFYFDSHQGNNLSNFFAIKNDLNSVHPLQQTYYIGILKAIFGFNQTIFQLITLLFKSLAAISVAFLIFKLTKDKLFSILAIFFFTVFPSTAGILYVLTGMNYLIVVFMSFSIYFYIQSAKKEKKILLASLLFFLALSAGPARSYLLLPIPLMVELVRLRRSFRPFTFLRRLVIFYFPLIFLRSYPGSFTPTYEISVRLKQLASGNLYTLTLPFQELSTLFIDQHILQDILTFGRLLIPFIPPDINGFLVLNSILVTLSMFLGFVFKGKQKMWSFVLKIVVSTFTLEVIFYVLGQFGINNGKIAFNDLAGDPYWYAPLNPTVYQASLGGYFLLLGGILTLEWWRNQRDNNTLKITVFGWFWAVFSIFLLYITNYRYEMIAESIDRYTFVCSAGAVIFIAGIFALSFKGLEKIKNLNRKLLLVFLFCCSIFMVAYQDYKYMNKYFSDSYNHQGDSGRMVNALIQNNMYQNFLTKFGKENLRKSVILYIDYGGEYGGIAFNQASFSEPIKYRIFYDENTNLIRNNCKVVVTDIKMLEKAFTIYNGEKGLIYDSICVEPEFGSKAQTIFYPLSNFYAYKMENEEFMDIKDEIIRRFDHSGQ